MACYWACGTKSNKVVWGIIAFMWFAGIVICSAGLIGGFTGDQCLYKFRDCMDATDNDSSWCSNILDSICQYKTWAALIASGTLIFWLGFVPMCYFCCCSTDPQQAGTAMQTGTIVAMQPYPQPQPGYAQPAYPQQPYPQQPYPQQQPYQGGVVQAQPYNPGMVQAQPYNPAVVQAQPYNPAGGVVQAQPYYPPPPEMKQ